MAYYEHIVQLPDNEMKCTLCDTKLQNSDTLLEAHLHDKRHKELYIKTLMTTNNIIMGTSDLYCYICSQRILVNELISHVQSSSHRNQYILIKNLVTLDGNLISLPDKSSRDPVAFCLICNKNVEFMYEAMKAHINFEVHKRAKAMILQPLNGIFSVEGRDEYLWCKVCKKYFDNYIEVISQHVSESDHAKTIGKILRLTNGQNIELEGYLQDLKEDAAWCKKCNAPVACNVDNLQNHINGKKHKST